MATHPDEKDDAVVDVPRRVPRDHFGGGRVPLSQRPPDPAEVTEARFAAEVRLSAVTPSHLADCPSH